MAAGGENRRPYLGRNRWPLTRRCGEDAHGRQTREWWQWQTCAQDVTRSWIEWLAADRFRSAECYGRYVSALDQEERAAAEFERVFLGTARGGE